MATSSSTLRHLQTLLSTEAGRLRGQCWHAFVKTHFVISVAAQPEIGPGGAILQARSEFLPSSVLLGFPNLVTTALMHQAF